jgi:hypothetical protein
VQTFRRRDTGITKTLTWSPLYGVHEITGQFRDVWLRYSSDLGPATGPPRGTGGKHARQDFVGGFIRYSDITETTYLGGLYCWDSPMNC